MERHAPGHVHVYTAFRRQLPESHPRGGSPTTPLVDCFTVTGTEAGLREVASLRGCLGAIASVNNLVWWLYCVCLCVWTVAKEMQYSGSIQDGQMHGRGHVRYANGEAYEVSA